MRTRCCSNGTPDFKLSAYLMFVIVVDESSIIGGAFDAACSSIFASGATARNAFGARIYAIFGSLP